MTKNGYSYYSGSRITLARAKQAKRQVVLARMFLWGTPMLAVAALIVFTPVAIWGPIVGVFGTCGLVGLAVFKWDDFSRWYRNAQRDYRVAVEEGVRDE